MRKDELDPICILDRNGRTHIRSTINFANRMRPTINIRTVSSQNRELPSRIISTEHRLTWYGRRGTLCYIELITMPAKTQGTTQCLKNRFASREEKAFLALYMVLNPQKGTLEYDTLFSAIAETRAITFIMLKALNVHEVS